MTGLLPLVMLWVFSKRDSSSAPASSFGMPNWPTPFSPPPMPPPPIPAFDPRATPTDAASTATPLAALAHPADNPATTPSPAKKPRKPLAKPVKRSPAAAAAAAAKKKLSPASALRAARGGFSLTTTSTKNVSVLEAQQILNRLGAGLKPDGLYGPKTASAWQRIAKSKGQAPTISRVGPKIAKVSVKTYDALKVPPIP